MYDQTNATKKCRSLSLHVGYTKKKFNPRAYIKSKSTLLSAKEVAFYENFKWMPGAMK